MDLKRGDELHLEISQAAFSAKGGSAYGGEGTSIARHEGFVVFVQGAVPGDVVTARILKTKKNFAEAKVLRIETPSKLRTEPRCKHFGVCGGCKWQNLEYSAQLRFKQQHVVDSFERIGGFRDLNVQPILGADEIYFYRNKMEFSFSDQEWLESPPLRPGAHQPAVGPAGLSSGSIDQSPINSHLSPVFLGLHVPQRYDKVLEIEECHLQSPVSNRILNFVRDFARESNLPVYNSEDEAGYLRFLVIRQSQRTNELMVNLVTFDDRPDVMRRLTNELRVEIPEITTVVNTINTRKAQIAYGDVERLYYGEGVIHENLGGYSFTVSASSFFQTNTGQAERLFEVAKSFADTKSGDVLYDLYSGTGSIALFVSDAVKEVVGVESVKSAIDDAERNVRVNGVTNCKFVLGDLKDRLTIDTKWMQMHEKPNVFIIDPPRSGMHPKVVEEILLLAPERIVYVSCNPATQARDMKLLCAEKYRLVKLQPVDMFPHTYHIENVALMTLK